MNYWIILFFLILIIAIIYVSCKLGKEKAKNKQLKEEINRIAKEQEYVNKQINKIDNMSSHDIRNRLHQLANKQSNNM